MHPDKKGLEKALAAVQVGVSGSCIGLLAIKSMRWV